MGNLTKGEAAAPQQVPEAHGPFAAHLRAFGHLSEADLDALSAAVGNPRHCEAGRDLLDPANGVPLVILLGWVGAARFLSEGRRQLVGLRLPGDVTDPSLAHMRRLTALTPVVYAEIPDLAALLERDSVRKAWTTMRALERDAVFDHMLRLGRVSAIERVAHLLLELHERLQRVGLASPTQFPLPISQEALADTLGLSLVHMNRTWAQLRREGVLAGQHREVIILDGARLAEIAEGAAPSPRLHRT